MSKRRKRKAGSEPLKAEERKEKERPKKEKAPEIKIRKTGKAHMKKMLPYSVAIAVVFFVMGFFVGPTIMGGVTTSGTTDQLIFISPPGCTNCEEMEPLVKEVADTLGVSFTKTGFSQQLENPGFVLVYNNNFLGVSGFDSEASLKEQVCLITENDEICEESGGLTPPEPPTPPPPEVTKSDRPEAHAFIMSYCPYGLQFLKAYVPVIELLGEKADIQVNFVHYIMHGEKEMTENTRMHCIQKEEKAKFTDYLRCFVEFDDPEKCMSEAGIDSSAIDTCMETTDTEFELTKTFQESTERFPPYGVDATLAQQYGVGGSPTFGINGQQVQVNRTPEAIKQAICAAFNSPPEECSQTLSSAPEAPGLGPVGSGGGSGSQAQC